MTSKVVYTKVMASILVPSSPLSLVTSRSVPTMLTVTPLLKPLLLNVT